MVFLKPSTVKNASIFIAKILGIVSNPASIILLIFPGPKPSTPNVLKKAVIIFSLTVLSSSLSFKTKSTFVSFQS